MVTFVHIEYYTYQLSEKKRGPERVKKEDLSISTKSYFRGAI